MASILVGSIEMRQALAIFAKSPRLGETKTRLIAELGAAGAMDAHCRLVDGTLDRLRSLSDVERSLWVTEAGSHATSWAKRHACTLRLQTGADLGAKMDTAIETLLCEGATRVCLVGSDCPPIDADYVRAGFEGLAHSDLVLGPAEDGGYGLIGLSRPCSALFTDIPWGSPDVFDATLRAAAALALRVCVLDTIWDVDTPQDWQRYLRFAAR